MAQWLILKIIYMPPVPWLSGKDFWRNLICLKDLLSVLNDALRLGQVMITDVESNFTIEDQKINTDNLRLKGPTIVLLGKGWVNFDQYCDLNMTVDLSSGVVPPIAHDVLTDPEHPHL